MVVIGNQMRLSSTSEIRLDERWKTALTREQMAAIERRDVYSRGKAMPERALVGLHRERGLPLVIARPGVVLGKGAPIQHPGLGLWVRDNHCVAGAWGESSRQQIREGAGISHEDFWKGMEEKEPGKARRKRKGKTA